MALYTNQESMSSTRVPCSPQYPSSRRSYVSSVSNCHLDTQKLGRDMETWRINLLHTTTTCSPITIMSKSSPLSCFNVYFCSRQVYRQIGKEDIPFGSSIWEKVEGPAVQVPEAFLLQDPKSTFPPSSRTSLGWRTGWCVVTHLRSSVDQPIKKDVGFPHSYSDPNSFTVSLSITLAFHQYCTSCPQIISVTGNWDIKFESTAYPLERRQG